MLNSLNKNSYPFDTPPSSMLETKVFPSSSRYPTLSEAFPNLVHNFISGSILRCRWFCFPILRASLQASSLGALESSWHLGPLMWGTSLLRAPDPANIGGCSLRVGRSKTGHFALFLVLATMSEATGDWVNSNSTSEANSRDFIHTSSLGRWRFFSTLQQPYHFCTRGWQHIQFLILLDLPQESSCPYQPCSAQSVVTVVIVCTHTEGLLLAMPQNAGLRSRTQTTLPLGSPWQRAVLCFHL